MMKLKIVTLFLVLGYTVFSQTFDSLLLRAGMVFIEPLNLTKIKSVENGQMNWENAYKSSVDKFEIRYAIRPLDSFLQEYEENMKNKKEGDIYLNPNNWLKSSFEATLLNISGGQLPNYDVFDFQSVKEEFNADWGATALVKTIDEFGQGYEISLVVFLHKDNKGDCFIFYMGDDVAVISSQMEALFHNIKFK